MTTTVQGETLEQFSARMGQVEKVEEFHVGSTYRGHSRAVFCFEGQFCYLEQLGYSTFGGLGLSGGMRALLMAVKPAPVDFWWTDFFVNGKSLAESIASHYGAEIEEEWYSDGDDWHFRFRGEGECDDGWDKLMRFVFDRHTGEFNKMFA